MGSNIHSLSDLPARDRWSPQPERSTEFLMGSSSQRCIDMFLPGFTWNSCILWISFLQIIVFIITLFVGSSGLEPHSSVLQTFGCSYGPSIQAGQVQRFVTPIFLHAGIWHLLFNVYFQLRMAFPLENTYGKWKMLAVYFVTGIAGNLFSVAIAPCKISIGASTAGFGFIGVQMAEMALFWHLLQNRDQAIFNIVLFVVISVMLSVSPHSALDWRGHLGGFIAGFCSGLLLNKNMDNPPRWLSKFGVPPAMLVLLAQYICCIVVIFAIPMTGPEGRCS